MAGFENLSNPSHQYLNTRRQTVALDKGIQLRKTFDEWLNDKTEDNRRRSLHTMHTREIERLREEQSRLARFSNTKSYDDWKCEKENELRVRLEEAREKSKEHNAEQTRKERGAEELRAKKYNEWLVNKFHAELAAEERKIQELMKNREKLKKMQNKNDDSDEDDIRVQKIRSNSK